MTSNPVLTCIADLVEDISPEAQLDSLATRLTAIERMTEKARGMLLTPMSDQSTHQIFLSLGAQSFFPEHAFLTASAIAILPNTNPALAAKANDLSARAKAAQHTLMRTLRTYYDGMSTPHPGEAQIQSRPRVEPAEIVVQLEAAAAALSGHARKLSILATISPSPLGAHDVEEGREVLRKNRRELLMTARHFPMPGVSTGDATLDALHIAIHGYIDAIAHALESMELSFAAIEATINGATNKQAETIN